MKPADNIHKLIKKLHVEPGADMDRKVHSRITKALEKWEKTKSADPQPNIWRIIMKNRITKIAAAAVIIIAVLFGINQFGSSIDGASVAWADIAGKVERIQNVVYRTTIETIGLPTEQITKTESLVYISSEYGTRMDSYMADKLVSTTYRIPNDNAVVTVFPEKKKFWRIVLPPDKARQINENNDPRQLIKEFMLTEHEEELGPSQIDGIDVEGIEVNSPRTMGGIFEDATARLWVDVRTDLPVLMEIEGVDGAGQAQIKMVEYDFQWDVELDASIFEPNIPDDYREIKQLKEDSEVNESTTVKVLRTFAEIANGRYPSNLTIITLFQELGEAVKAKDEGTLSQQKIEKTMQLFLDIKPADAFYAKLAREDKDVAYYGDTVTADDADAVLMRWKISDNQYRVIFGDLTTENVTPEQLAELEKLTLK